MFTELNIKKNVFVITIDNHYSETFYKFCFVKTIVQDIIIVLPLLELNLFSHLF